MKILVNRNRLIMEPSPNQSLISEVLIDTMIRKCTTYKVAIVNGKTGYTADKQFCIKDLKDDDVKLLMHTNQLPEIEKALNQNGLGCEIKEINSTHRLHEIPGRLKPGIDYRDDLQLEYAKYLEVNRPVYLCTMQTGKGKTASTLIHILKKPKPKRITLLIPPKYHVIWTKAFEEFTDIPPEDILTVSGRESLLSLRYIEDNIQIIIISPPTIREYIKDYYKGIVKGMNPSKIMNYIGSEYLIVDEAHSDFHNNYINILVLNPMKTILLTATYSSTNDDPKVAKFKNLLIPKDSRMPEQALDKYVNAVFCQFRFMDVYRLKFINPRFKFYSHLMLESSILKDRYKKQSYFDLIMYFIDKYYDNKNRLLVLFAMNNTVNEFFKYIKKNSRYKGKKIVTFIQGGKDEAKLEADIIISTDKSCGTGIDIKNLQTTMNTISTKSEYFGVQSSGRNRKMDDVEQYYLTLWATNIEAQTRYKHANTALLNQRAKQVYNDYYAERSV